MAMSLWRCARSQLCVSCQQRWDPAAPCAILHTMKGVLHGLTHHAAPLPITSRGDVLPCAAPGS